MGEETSIRWCAYRMPDGRIIPGKTFNPWIGCTKVSQGCKHCYAETQNNRYRWNRAGWGPGAARKQTSEAYRKMPVRWAKEAVRLGVVYRIFGGSLMDPLDSEVPQSWREEYFSLIDETGTTGGVEWVLLTKRIENAGEMLPGRWLESPPDYVRFGVTAEDQENADQRIPELLGIWKGKNFISYEPALGPLDLSDYLPDGRKETCPGGSDRSEGIHWVMVGGESGAGCRPMDLSWARATRDQCRGANVPYFFKQLGGHPNKRDDPAGWPEDLRVQEFPEGPEHGGGIRG